MKKISIRQVLSWFLISTTLSLISPTSEARFFLQYSSIELLSKQQESSVAPIIKVEEYQYLEKKLIPKKSEHYFLDFFFGEDEHLEDSEARVSNPPRTNRILLPQMVGGLSSLFAHIEYPVQAKATGVEGIVKVEFTVTELGMVEHIKIIEGIGTGCDEQVIEALKQTRFSPAVQNGRFIKVTLSQSILFELKPLSR